MEATWWRYLEVGARMKPDEFDELQKDYQEQLMQFRINQAYYAEFRNLYQEMRNIYQAIRVLQRDYSDAVLHKVEKPATADDVRQEIEAYYRKLGSIRSALHQIKERIKDSRPE